MSKQTRITINVREVVEQFYRCEFDTSYEGIIAERLWTGWQNMIETVGVSMMTPHRRNRDQFLRTFIPTAMYVRADESEDRGYVTALQVTDARFPASVESFREQLNEVYAWYSVTAPEEAARYVTWCMYVYGAMLRREADPVPFRHWAGIQAGLVAMRTPHTLLHDVAVTEKPILSQIVPSYLKYGDRYLAGLNLGLCSSTFMTLAGDVYATAREIGRMLDFAFKSAKLTETDELIAALLIDRNTISMTGWSFDDTTHTPLHCMLTGRLGPFEFNRGSRRVIRDIQAMLLRGRVHDRLNSVDDDATCRKLPADLAKACHAVMEQYLAEHPNAAIVDGTLARH
jgi:hypothetical protein